MPRYLRTSSGCSCTASLDRTKDDTLFGELLFEGGAHGHAVKHRVHGHARQPFALLQRNAELLVGFQELRIHFVEAFRSFAGLLRRGVVDDVLVIDGFVMDLWPGRFFHRLPVPERLEPPVGQPRRFVFLARNQPDDVLVQTRRRGLGFHVGVETVFVFLFDQALNGFGGGAHFASWEPVFPLTPCFSGVCEVRKSAGTVSTVSVPRAKPLKRFSRSSPVRAPR